MPGRRIINEEDARRCLAAAKSFRGGVAAWAQVNGVDGRSLNCWRVNLRRRKAPQPRALAPRLVELVPASMARAARIGYVLHIRGVELEVGNHFDEVSLRRLVRLLKSC